MLAKRYGGRPSIPVQSPEGVSMFRVCLIFVLTSAALAQENPFAADKTAADVGKGMFRIYCAPCHGIRAQGGRGPDLSRGVFRSGDKDSDLFHLIAEGVAGTEMAGWSPKLEDENIWRLVAYIRTVNRHDNTTVTGDAAHGESLFWGKGSCGNCHLVSGRGRSIGPDLSRVGRQRSVSYLRESIVSPNADISPGYTAIDVVTRDGKKITGIEQSYDNFSARIIDLAGKTYSFQRDKVSSMKREYRSLMPETYGSLF